MIYIYIKIVTFFGICYCDMYKYMLCIREWQDTNRNCSDTNLGVENEWMGWAWRWEEMFCYNLVLAILLAEIECREWKWVDSDTFRILGKFRWMAGHPTSNNDLSNKYSNYLTSQIAEIIHSDCISSNKIISTSQLQKDHDNRSILELNAITTSVTTGPIQLHYF